MWSRFRSLRYKGLLWLAGLSSMAFLWSGGPIYAATLVTISGTIRAIPNCVLNNNAPIAVDFGNAVRIDDINGSNFKTKVGFSIACKNIKGNTVRLQLLGTGASFDSSLLATQVSGLGIKFLVSGSAISVNQWFSVEYLRLPTLDAVLVKSTNANLSGGAFSANAELLVSYL